jgi:hypothetical protein
VVTVDLDLCEVVDQQRWDPAWSVAADDVVSWSLGGALIGDQQMNNGYGPSVERLPVGLVSDGLAVMPVGSQRLVGLSPAAIPRADAAPTGGSNGR